jgi:protein-S-isoprenylcysteine O-methyltransferase Ste14
MKLRSAGLFMESVIFTIVVPGSVTVLIPSLILGPEGRALPRPWSLFQFAALVPVSLGAAIYFRCLWEFATRGRGIPAPIDHPKQLVVTGLYRYVRNPMYVGVLMLLLGEALLFRSADLLAYTVCWFVFVHLNVVIWEERLLRHRFGDSYERYRAAVRRWIPGKRYAG